MTGVILSIFLGWAGGYRFYKKQYGIGILYLFTGGIFCFGWIFDIFCSIKEISQKNNVKFSKSDKELRFYDIVVRGVTYETKKSNRSRQDLLSYIKDGTQVYIEKYIYSDLPALSVNESISGEDIGSIPAEITSEIYATFSNPTFIVTKFVKYGGKNGKNYGCKIDFIVKES